LSLSLFSCIILVSIAAANKLFAAVTAWRSPIKCDIEYIHMRDGAMQYQYYDIYIYQSNASWTLPWAPPEHNLHQQLLLSIQMLVLVKVVEYKQMPIYVMSLLYFLVEVDMFYLSI
jgi:hypothetical protein